MGKTEVQVSPLNDHILDIRFVFSFSKYKDWEEHLEDVLEYVEDLPDFDYIKHEYRFRKQNGGVVEEIEPKKTLKDFREQLLEDWYVGQRRRV